jgi:glutamate-1-semialdehyde aminotransferase
VLEPGNAIAPEVRTSDGRCLTRSFELWRRAETLIPCGTQTLSKGPDQFVRGVSPIYIERGEGCRVYDVDGNEYIDYPMSLGPIILGHAYPATTEAIIRQLRSGTTFTLMHPLEVEVAELITACVPCADMVRFAKNGSDVTSAAIRLARALTGRERVVYCGYHGWQDWYVGATDRRAGVPRAVCELVVPFRYNDLESLDSALGAHPGEVAAVILEQGGEDPVDDFLQRVKDRAHAAGALLIFDEVVTGFRYALGGIQELYGVVPDLACLGKAVANGLPLSVLAGRREVMAGCEEIFFSMTFGGETLSLAAAAATIRELQDRDVIPYIWAIGTEWQRAFNLLVASEGVPVRCNGHPPRSHFEFGGPDPAIARALFLQETVKRGVLFGGPVFMTFAHSSRDIALTLDACKAALQVLHRAFADGSPARFLEGEPPRAIFRLATQGQR